MTLDLTSLALGALLASLAYAVGWLRGLRGSKDPWGREPPAPRLPLAWDGRTERRREIAAVVWAEDERGRAVTRATPVRLRAVGEGRWHNLVAVKLRVLSPVEGPPRVTVAFPDGRQLRSSDPACARVLGGDVLHFAPTNLVFRSNGYREGLP